MNESGRGYAAQWSFTLVSDVYTGGTVWEVESSAEENEVVERPVVKAKSVPSPKVSSVPKAASSSSRDLGASPTWLHIDEVMGLWCAWLNIF